MEFAVVDQIVVVQGFDHVVDYVFWSTDFFLEVALLLEVLKHEVCFIPVVIIDLDDILEGIKVPYHS